MNGTVWSETFNCQIARLKWVVVVVVVVVVVKYTKFRTSRQSAFILRGMSVLVESGNE